jgi:biopolymer transport protein ExbB
MQDLLAKGGALVAPILFCSVLAFAIFVERFIRFTILRNRGQMVDEQVTRSLAENDLKSAARTASDSKSPMGRILAQAMDVMGQDRETLETVLANAIEEEVRDLSRYLQALATIANIAPLLGLLGTVIGMIKAFMVIQEMGGKVNAAVLAGGIWEAMLTTALGLAVALPTMVAHSYLVSQVDRYEARLQAGTVRFVKTLGSLPRN